MLVDERDLYNELVDAGLIPDTPYNAATTQDLQVVRRIAAGLNKPLTTAAAQIYDKLGRLPEKLRKVKNASVFVVGCLYHDDRVPREFRPRDRSEEWVVGQEGWSVQWSAVLGEESGTEVVTGQAALLELAGSFPQDWEQGHDSPTEAIEVLNRDVVRTIESDWGTDVQLALSDVTEELGKHGVPARVCLIGESMGGPFEWRAVIGDVVESAQEAEESSCWVTANLAKIEQTGYGIVYEDPGDAIVALGEHVDGLQPHARRAARKSGRR